MDYKKLLNEESKIAIELDNYDDKWMRDYNDEWMRVNSDDPNPQVYSGRLTTVPQRPKPSFIGSCKKRYTPRKKEISYHEEECISEEKTLKEKP